jgi:hypothetical protein
MDESLRVEENQRLSNLIAEATGPGNRICRPSGNL